MENSNIFRISDKNFWNQIKDEFGNKGGVYLIFSKKDDKITPVNRLLGTDVNGILYIGKAISFLDRVINLKKTLSPKHKSMGHEAGIRLSDESISIKFPYETLYVKLIEDKEPKNKEFDLLQKYLISFGELPPLNRMQ